MYQNYDKTRMEFLEKRTEVWKEVAKHLQKYIRRDSTILDLGSGYCDFINSISAGKKYALDKYINPARYASKDVVSLFGGCSLIDKKIKNESLDVVFASNFFEHLNQEELEDYTKIVKKKLKANGIIIIIQPNYRLCYKNYFDDYTHTKAWSDLSFCDYLKSKNFSITRCTPKFLPFSMKSRIPKNRILVRIYLNSPIKLFAKQMLIIAKKRDITNSLPT